MTSPLLPCPFCGDDGDKGRQEVTQMNAERNKFTRIMCQACGCMCPEHNWNRRAAAPTQEPPDHAALLADASVTLTGAANYIDNLGGVSQGYRQFIAKLGAALKGTT